MAIPAIWSITKPLLKLTADSLEHRVRDLFDPLAQEFGLTQDELDEETDEGNVIFPMRVRWARTDLVQAGALASSRRGYISITTRGREILQDDPDVIDRAYLRRYPQFVEFLERKRASADGEPIDDGSTVPMTKETEAEPSGITNPWWVPDPLECYWMETTHRSDLGADLNCPQRGKNGELIWQYALIREARPRDVVFHYDANRSAIVAWSLITGSATSAQVAMPGGSPQAEWRVPLYHYTALQPPISLADLASTQDKVLAVRDELLTKHGRLTGPRLLVHRL